MQASRIKINDLLHPMGIYPDKVCISWIPEDGLRQSAFRITMEMDGKCLYNSGKILSSAMKHRADVEIPSKACIMLGLTLWDEKNIRGKTVYTEFETGPARTDWCAKWIDPEEERPEFCRRAMDGKPLNKASYLKKDFYTTELGKARLYMTAHGVYNVYINGYAIEEYFMAPGTSDYEHRLQVQTYDVGAYLKEGKNELVVTIGDGWWRGSAGWSMTRYCFGMDLALLCQLEIDGKPVVVSDATWVASQNGPLSENDTMRLEKYDARRQITDWHPVRVENFGFDNLVGTDLSITAHERFKPILFTTPAGQKVLDFGQNFAGYVELDLMAKGGERILLTHGEVLDQYGNFQTDNFQNPDSPLCRQVIDYTCKEGRNQYHQTKCYYGFRYAMIETDLPIDGSEFTGVSLYSDMEQTSFFTCGDARVNRLFQNVIWSMKSNFLDVPTDCPHREKLAFTGDCQVFASTALYLMDAYPVLRRWLRELVACQTEEGCILYVSPPKKGPQKGPIDKDGAAGFSNAITIVPHRLMQVLDEEQIREFYPAICRWIDYNLGRAKQSRPENQNLPEEIRNYILDCADNWGEWNEPNMNPQAYAEEGLATGHAEIATAFMAYDCLLASRMAARLGEKKDAARFYGLYQKTRHAYRALFTDNGKIRSNRQCHYVRAIVHELLDEQEKEEAAKSLAAILHANGTQIGTGFMTTCHIGDVLTDYGYSSLVYDLLLQTEQPSWLFEVINGATTIWESWYGIQSTGERNGSHNHYSLGTIAKWMITKSLGIEVLDGKITIQPHPDRRLGFAEGSFLSSMGKICSSWRYEKDTIRFEITLPPNVEAEIILPDGSHHIATIGTHIFLS